MSEFFTYALWPFQLEFMQMAFVIAVLVMAMLVTPGATAYLLTDRFSRMIGLAVAMGVVTSIVGAYASYFFDGSTGGCIVTLQSALFALALVFGPKHGMIAARGRRNAAKVEAA